MGILCGFDELSNVIMHDVNSMERYSNKSAEHFLSTICFKNASEMESEMLADILVKASRKSDIILYKERAFVLVMPATDKKGAKHTFEEIHSVCGKIEKISIYSYPKDAANHTEYYKIIEDSVNEINNL